MEVVRIKASALLMAASAAFLIFCSFQTAIAQQGCTPVIINEVIGIATYCIAPIFPPVARGIGAQSLCCNVSQNFDFACSCSPLVLSLQDRGVINSSTLINAANYCGITLPRGLQCLGVQTP
ncbi:hypothetical protein Adt_48715 [Abeliophyllum distichum]|uniref:Bifunctional inhibitor/plant lipid transfer protein/seed storage helical domain-containing protein n=1 Tax=Abeliophyllum distichum TaxID=126358 RepID=A0ABD1NQ95_9LAMI